MLNLAITVAPRERRNRALVGLAVVAAATAVLAARPHAANATTVYFDCGVLAPGQWCLRNESRQWYKVNAWYEGNDEILVAAKLIRTSHGDDLFETSSLSNLSSGVSVYNWGRINYTKPGIQNGSALSHTVKGYGVY